MNSQITSPAGDVPLSLPLCQRSATEIILRTAGEPTSMAHFLANAKALAEQLPDQPYVINLHRNRHDFLLAFCASVIAGQCTLMPSNRQEQTLAELERAYPGCYRCGDQPVKTPRSPNSGQPDESFVIPEIPAQQLCAIAFTSGSTGQPNPNPKTWQMLFAGTQSNCQALLHGHAGPASLLATVPSQHMWGLETSVLMPLFASLAVAATMPLYPQDIVTALQQLPAPRILVSSPLHLQALLKSGLKAPELDLILTATAPLSQQLATELEAVLGAPVLDVFGSTETGIFANRHTATEELWNLAAPFRIEMVEQKPKVSAPHLPAAVPLADQLELVGETRFRWLAREQDQVNVAGKRASLADLNRRLLAIEGVEDGMIFKPSDSRERLAAVIVAPGLVAADIRQALLPDIDPVFIPRPVVFVATMPRGETGKLPLSAVQEVYEAARRSKITDAS